MTTTDSAFAPFTLRPGAPPHATQCKSTLVVSSIRALQEAGLYKPYSARIAPAHRDAVLQCVAGAWLPMDTAVAHYEACDALGLTPAEQARIGASVADRIHKSIFSTLVRMAAAGGVTPWAVLDQFHRFFDRLFDGGSTRVTRIGLKDARIEIAGMPLARIPYFVYAYRGGVQAGAELFASKAVCGVVPRFGSSTSMGFRLAWA